MKIHKPNLGVTLILFLGAGVLLLIAYFFGFIFLANRVVSHPLFSAQNYHRLYDWDLPQHVMNQDLDGDGKSDLISFTGCALLSKADPSQIPVDRRCQARGIFSMNQDASQDSVGQVYLKTPLSSYTLDHYFDQMDYYYAYAFQDQQGTWFIVSQQGLLTSPQTMKIGPDSLLVPVPTPIIHQFHVFVYKASNLLLVPLFYLMDFIWRGA